MKSKYKALCLLCMAFGTSIAQTTDTIVLNEIPLLGESTLLSTDENGYSLSQSPGTLSKDLSEALYSNHTTHVRSFGPGQATTFSSRGASANQVGVFWNNLNIASPSLGVADASLVPLDLFSVTQYTGGHSAAEGNQAMGSSLLISSGESPSSFVQLGMGSFNMYSGKGSFAYSLGSWKLRSQISAQAAENNYTYIYRDVEHERENAAAHFHHIIQEAEVSIPSIKGEAWLGAWYTNALRENPASIISTQGNPSTLYDDQFKLSGRVTSQTGKNHWKLTTGLQWQQQRFTDFNEQFKDTNLTINSQVSGQWERPITDYLKAYVAADYLYSRTYGTATRHADQNNIALHYGLYYTRKGTKAQLIIRHEAIDTTVVPFIPSLAFSQKLIAGFSLVGKAGYQFRYPTLNDRFWIQGGNPDVKPETGSSGEIGLYWEMWGIELRSVYFTSRIDDYIAWNPGPSGFWTPQNIKQVESKGLETTLNGNQTLGKSLLLNYRLGHTWNEVVTTQSEIANDQSIGKQIIYTPENKIHGGLEVSLWDLTLGSSYTYTSETFANSDHRPSSRIEAFGTWDFSVGYRYPLGKTMNTGIRFQVLNATDQAYETVKYYPMPGRNYTLTLDFKF